MMKLILIRHGETTWNDERRIQGCRSDTELSQTGMEQAEKLASLFRSQKLDAVYSSPLKRALHTAQAIARACRMEVSIEFDLREMDAGDLEGLTEKDLLKRFGDFWQQRRQWAPSLVVPGGESLEGLQERAWGAIQGIRRKYPDGTVAVVGHLVVNLAIVCRALELDLQNMRVLRQDTTGVNVLELSGQGNSLSLFNDTCHLDRNRLGGKSSGGWF
jgi:alpha-ribazole phosphatase